MSLFLYSIFGFIVAMGILVAFHEFGHFWVARRCGVKVLRFSVGFGPVLWSRIGKDGTEYALSAIPLGGYVKMLDSREDDVPDSELHHEFNAQPVWQRMLIVLAGPAANFLLAIVAIAALNMWGLSGYKMVVKDVEPNSIAAEAGLRSGDYITAIEGEPAEIARTAYFRLMQEALWDNKATIEVERNGDTRTLTLDYSDAEKLRNPKEVLLHTGISIVRPKVPPVIGKVVAGAPAEKAGLRRNDTVVSVENVAVTYWGDMVKVLAKRKGEKTELVVLRDGKQRTLSITPIQHPDTERSRGYVGIGPSEAAAVEENKPLEARQQLGFGAAIYDGAVQTWDLSRTTLLVFWRMIMGDMSWKNVSGPINIAENAGQTVQIGLVSFVMFIAIISISLGVINLLPIPVLDGGHLMYYVCELVKGSPVSAATQLRGQQLGMVMLLMLMAVAFYNDITRLL